MSVHPFKLTYIGGSSSKYYDRYKLKVLNLAAKANSGIEYLEELKYSLLAVLP